MPKRRVGQNSISILQELAPNSTHNKTNQRRKVTAATRKLRNADAKCDSRPAVDISSYSGTSHNNHGNTTSSVSGAKRNFRCMICMHGFDTKRAMSHHRTVCNPSSTPNFVPAPPTIAMPGTASPGLPICIPNSNHESFPSQDQENLPTQSQTPKDQIRSNQIIKDTAHERQDLQFHQRHSEDIVSPQQTIPYKFQIHDDEPDNISRDSDQKHTSDLKPDSEVSETTRQRRKLRAKRKAAAQREKEARIRRIQELLDHGVQRREGPCSECQHHGVICKVFNDPTLRKIVCLECRQHQRRRCKFPDLTAAISKTFVSLHAGTGRALKTTPAVQKSVGASVRLPVYTDEWYRNLRERDRPKKLAELIDSDNPDIKSGKLRVPGPCLPCFSLGLECKVIEEGSTAYRMSPSTTRCSNCLVGRNRNWTKQSNHSPASCCNVPAGYVLIESNSFVSEPAPPPSSAPSAARTTKVTLKSGGEETRTTTTVPLKSADSSCNPEFRDSFRRQSRKLTQRFPGLFSNDDPLFQVWFSLQDIKKLAKEMHECIEVLASTVEILHRGSSGTSIAFETVSLLELDGSHTDESLPTMMTALALGLGIPAESAASYVRERIEQLGINSLALSEVVHLISSLTIYNLVMHEDPFAEGHVATKTRSLLSAYQSVLGPHQRDDKNEEMLVDQFHLNLLSRDHELSKNLAAMANINGEKMFRVLSPLLVFGMEHVAEPYFKDLQDKCLNVARAATGLNAQLKARKHTIPATIFWPHPRQTFDKRSHNYISEGNSASMREVVINLCWGIKMDNEIVVKAECDAI